MIPKMFVMGSANLDLFSKDAFNGAFAAALERNKSPFQAIQCVKEAGLPIVYRFGPRPSLQISGELEQFVASSAAGLNPAVQTVVDLPEQTNTLL